jgi:hypothetical protein
MSLGRVVMMLQAKARSYRRAEKSRNEPKKATFAQIKAWAGVGSL